jgi:hypothetical protein
VNIAFGLEVDTMTIPRLRADFNGLFDAVLCLSHGDTCLDETGKPVLLRAGMVVIAFDEEYDDNGQRDDIMAQGTVEPSPAWLQPHGSKWVLRLDENGVRHESDRRDAARGPPPDRPRD